MAKKLPAWAEPALQGIAYWMGYRKQYHKYFDLPEAAIKSELCSLINNSLKNEDNWSNEELTFFY